jgi:hypothetical protein
MDAVEYDIVRVDTRADIPNPPVVGTQYFIADEGVTALARPNGIRSIICLGVESDASFRWGSRKYRP